jgi:hypothetical protein
MRDVWTGREPRVAQSAIMTAYVVAGFAAIKLFRWE